MKICLVTPVAHIDGGIASHVRTSAKHLRAAGYEVMLVTGDAVSAGTGTRIEGLSVGVQPDAVRRSVIEASLSCDLVHVHNVDDPQLISELASRLPTAVSAHAWSGCPSGLRYFGQGRECFRTRGPTCVANMLLRDCDHRLDPRRVLRDYHDAGTRLQALGAAHIAVAHSSAVAHHLGQNGLRNVVLVPLPVDVSESPPALPGSRVIFSGRLTPAKGVHVLLDACRYFTAPVDICGDGWAMDALKRQTSALGLAERVRFHGWCANSVLADLYAEAALAVVPSLWPEPFGLVGPEAMGYARPVVATETGGISDWLDHERTGLAVRPGRPRELGEAIGALLDDPALRVRMGQEAYLTTKARWSPAAHIAGLTAAYSVATGLADV